MPHYQIVMLPKPDPNQRKVLWYDFKKSVPDVAAEKAFGTSKMPRGEKDPQGRTIIAYSLTPASNKQVIWQPKHPEAIPEDIPSPNVAALSEETAPAPRPPLKQFIPPPAERPKTEPAPMVEPPPAISKSVVNLQDRGILRELQQRGLISNTKMPSKPFIPPTSPSGTGPDLSKMIEPPSLPASAGSEGSMQGIVVGLDPTDQFTQRIPEGSRSAQFARAPSAGAPSSGSSSSPNAPKVPGVTALASSAQPIETTAPLSEGSVPKRRVMREIVFPSVNRTVSAPLHPSSRIVPATVDAHFANRDVFALVIPSPKLLGYAGNWVVWFAAQKPEVANAARILAPIPARKEESDVDVGTPQNSDGKGVVQFEAVVDSNGRVLAPRVLSGPISESFRHRALAELRTWEFKPTLRNGEPIGVDVVLEIPFEFRATSAQTH